MGQARLPKIGVSGAERVQQILAGSACSSSSTTRGCRLTMHVGVFFDVVGNNAERDPVNEWTNIGLMWRSFPLSQAEKSFPIYVPGLATTFESDKGSYFKSVGASALNEKAGALQDDWKRKCCRAR
ncbi:hypothetical protein [Chromobacterium vaccinii]|uniref:hypothetical protein n=1 Tax=Chromobacterium vaccinii TaxID=1108595 RepID=UPI0011C02036|nr:hypothetical protein [Chromobacterium vaccinii]